MRFGPVTVSAPNARHFSYLMDVTLVSWPLQFCPQPPMCFIYELYRSTFRAALLDPKSSGKFFSFLTKYPLVTFVLFFEPSNPGVLVRNGRKDIGGESVAFAIAPKEPGDLLAHVSNLQAALPELREE